LNPTLAVLLVRPRGWHLPEKHVVVDGNPMSGALFDFGLFFWHNAKEQLARGQARISICPNWKATWKRDCGMTCFSTRRRRWNPRAIHIDFVHLKGSQEWSQ